MSNSTAMENDYIYKAGWESPSNIAIVKYWGKHSRQLPLNPSVSFTLSNAASRTFVSLTDKQTADGIEMTFLFEGKENQVFASRIEKFLVSLSDEFFPFLKKFKLHIDSSNSFPHSSGIASSASGMSALALCLCDLAEQTESIFHPEEALLRKASLIARLGSGSACRSVYPELAVWGRHDDIAGSADDYAIGIGDRVHPDYLTFHDDILIISAGEKSVSSSAGHGLMTGNPYAEARYQQAMHRMSMVMDTLQNGDIDAFGKIAEDEALTLHALMMCSDPSYMLMEEGSLSVIRKIKAFRKETGIPVYFTLDAGPNVHVLYPDKYEAPVHSFISEDLRPYCHDGKIIRDKVGKGPVKISG